MSKAEADFEDAQDKMNNMNLDDAKKGSKGLSSDCKDDGVIVTDRFAMMVNKSKAAGEGDSLGRSMRDDLGKSARGAIMKGLDYLGGLGSSRHGTLESAAEMATAGHKDFK